VSLEPAYAYLPEARYSTSLDLGRSSTLTRIGLNSSVPVAERSELLGARLLAAGRQ
jgi:hypothetical protein